MDFLDPAKKRQHTIRLFIGYMLVAIALALTSWLIFLLALGYSYNSRTGRVIQNGLVFVESKPVSADVYANGQLKGKTGLRLNIPSGNYTFLLKSSGYRDWSRTFYLDGGSVQRLIYPLLFPTKLVRTDQQLYDSTPTLATQSPDKRWLLIQLGSSISKINEVDLGKASSNQVVLSLPLNLLTPKSGSQKLSVIQWSTDNQHVLLLHTFKGGNEYIMFDRADPSNSINLNKLFKQSPTSLVMRDQRYDKLLIYNKKTQIVSGADVKSKIVSSLLTKVISFNTNGPSQIIYVTNDRLIPGKLAVKLWDGQKNYLINHYPANTDYKIVAGKFGGDDYLVIAPIITGDAYIYKNPLSSAQSGRAPQPFKVLRVKDLKFVSFSTKDRFVVAQSGGHFGVYDIDNDSRYYYQLSPGLPTNVEATWFDAQHLTLPNNGKTLVLDYDGNNQQTLSATLPGLSAFFDPSLKGLYNIAPSVESSSKIALTRTELTIQ